MKYFSSLSLSVLCVALSSSLNAAKPLPLSKKYWQDASFLKSFNGAYQANARIEPSVTSQQRGLLVKVQNAMQKGKRQQALDILTSSKLTVSSAALLYNKGNLLFELGKNAEAIKAYNAALKIYPSFRRAHRNLGTVLLHEGKHAESLVELKKAVQLGDIDGSTMGLLGYCYLQKEKYASALQAYRMAQLSQPDTIEWKAGVAQCLAEIGEDEEARVLVEEVIEQRPEEASYQLLLVNILLKLERDEEAAAGLELLRRESQLEPSHLALLAQLHLREGSDTLAKPVMTELVKKLEASVLPDYLRVVELVIQNADWGYAESLLAEVKTEMKLDPKLKNKRSRLKAFVMMQQGKEGAEELLSEIISNDPNDGEALLLLAQQHVNQSEFEEAALLFERGSKLEAFAYRALLAHGKMLVSQKRYSKAAKKLDAALALQDSAEVQRYAAAVKRLAAAE